MNYNFCLQIGHITRDIVLTYLPNQTPVIDFGIANNRRWVQDGQKKEDVMFLDCRSYGKTATNIHKFFSKGKPILVEGRLQLDRWADKEGRNHSKHRLVVRNFEFVASRSPQDAPGSANAPNQAPAPSFLPDKPFDEPAPPTFDPNALNEADPDDGIPF